MIRTLCFRLLLTAQVAGLLATICLNSSLKSDGIVIGNPRQSVVYLNAPADPRLAALANSITTTPALKPAHQHKVLQLAKAGTR